jgi:hypothetical protein
MRIFSPSCSQPTVLGEYLADGTLTLPVTEQTLDMLLQAIVFRAHYMAPRTSAGSTGGLGVTDRGSFSE